MLPEVSAYAPGPAVVVQLAAIWPAGVPLPRVRVEVPVQASRACNMHAAWSIRVHTWPPLKWYSWQPSAQLGIHVCEAA